MRITVPLDVAAPPELVFDMMADTRNEVEWNSQVTACELTSGEPVGPGSTFRTVNRGQEYVATIRDHERPGWLTFVVDGKPMAIAGRMTFTAVAEGTHLDAVFDLQAKGPLQVLFPLMAPLVRRQFPRELASFKRLCESRAAT